MSWARANSPGHVQQRGAEARRWLTEWCERHLQVYRNKTVTVTKQIGQLIDPEYSTIIYAETYNGTVSGHTIWGTTITQNNWMDGNHNWNCQTDASGNHLSGCIGNGCPTTGGIELYWEDGKYPHDSGSAGGTMDNCLYASYGPYPYCTVGG
jgi:hypothetical protein